MILNKSKSTKKLMFPKNLKKLCIAILFVATFPCLVFGAKIGIYPGSFDPIHIGHLEVARSALEKLDLDAVYIMPNGANPRKPNMSPIRVRAAIIEAALKEQGIEQIKLFSIKKIEESALAGDPNDAPVRILELARNSFEKDCIYQILGTDSVFKVLGGSGYKRINCNWRLAVCNRPGVKAEKNEKAELLKRKGLLKFFDSFSDLVISSSAIRKACSNGNVDFLQSVMPKSAYKELIRQGAHGLDTTSQWLEELLKNDWDTIPTHKYPMSEPVILKQCYQKSPDLGAFKAVRRNPFLESTVIDFLGSHSLGDVRKYVVDKLTPSGMQIIANPAVEIMIFPGNQKQLSHWLASNGISNGIRVTRNRSFITLGIHLVKKVNGKFMAVIDEVYGLDRMRHTQAIVAAGLALGGRDKSDFCAMYEVDGAFPANVRQTFSDDLTPVIPGTIDAAIIGFHWKIINDLEQRHALFNMTNNKIALTKGKISHDWRRRTLLLSKKADKQTWPRRHFPRQNIPFSYLAFKNAQGKAVNILLCRNVYGDQLESLLDVLIHEKKVSKIVMFGNAGGLADGSAVGDRYFPDEVRRFDTEWEPIKNELAINYQGLAEFKSGRIFSVFSPLVETDVFVADLKEQNTALVDVENGYIPDIYKKYGQDKIKIASMVIVSDVPGSEETLAHLKENEAQMSESMTECIDAIINYLGLVGPSDHPFPIAN